MGIQLVLQVLEHRSRLSDRAFGVLVCMAATALDTTNERGQPPGLYFAGWELLARKGLGRDVPEADPSNPEVTKARDRVAETVRRAIKDCGPLVEAVGGKAARGRRQTYRLSLSPTAAVPLHPPAAVGLAAPKPHRTGGVSPTATVPPRSSEEPEGEGLIQESSTPVCDPATDRDNDLSPDEIRILSPRRPHDYISTDGLYCDCGTPEGHPCHNTWRSA